MFQYNIPSIRLPGVILLKNQFMKDLIQVKLQFPPILPLITLTLFELKSLPTTLYDDVKNESALTNRESLDPKFPGFSDFRNLEITIYFEFSNSYTFLRFFGSNFRHDFKKSLAILDIRETLILTLILS